MSNSGFKSQLLLLRSTKDLCYTDKYEKLGVFIPSYSAAS